MTTKKVESTQTIELRQSEAPKTILEWEDLINEAPSRAQSLKSVPNPENRTVKDILDITSSSHAEFMRQEFVKFTQ